MPVIAGILYVICGAAGIISLLVMKSGLLAWYDTGGVGSLLVGAAGIVIVCFGFASLFDRRQPPSQR
jgi:uncharacterized membrane protein YuzA (DUF378 family)